MESAPTIVAPRHLGFVAKMRVFAASVLAVIVMFSVAWSVARPVDPEMAVTLTLSGRSAFAVLPGLLALMAVLTAVGSVIIGPRLPEGGVFAACVGLTGLAYRGGGMGVVLMYHGSTEAAGRRALMATLAGDVLLWTLVVVASWFTAAAVRRWLWPSPPARELPPEEAAAADRVAPKIGWQALVITVIVGALVIWLTAGRTAVAPVQRVQAMAAVAGGMVLGVIVARYVTGIGDPRWYLLAVPLVALIGCLLGYLNADMSWADGAEQPYAELATTPPHALVRALPIEYLAVGTAAALAGFWSAEKIRAAAEEVA